VRAVDVDDLLARAVEGPAPPGLTVLERQAWDHLADGDLGEGGLRVEPLGRHLQLRFDNPAARGALSLRMMLQLAAVSLTSFPPRMGLLLRGGAPGSFCAGGDLRAVRARLGAPAGGAAMHTIMVGALQRILARDAPVVALVEGPALGGGAELCTWADEVLMGDGAQIGFPQLRLGLSPGWGGGVRLIRRVGAGEAARLLRRGGPISADHAYRIGLADEIVALPEAEARAESALDRLSALPSGALPTLRRLIDTADPQVEAQLFLERWGGPAHLAALDAVPQGRRS
jgi:ethylmalonyl-CoA/methylmalonyl-CoA decarboxylase